MQKENFRNWLAQKRTPRAVSDCISRCLRVEKALSVDLDDEYAKDGGRRVIESLSYGKREADIGVVFPNRFGFSEGCNQVQRYTDIRSATKKYFSFCEATKENDA